MAVSRVPLSLSGELIENLRGKDSETGKPLEDRTLDSLRDALASAQATAQQIEVSAKAIAADPTRTPTGNALRIRDLATRLGETAAKNLDRARAKTLEELDRLEAKLAALPAVEPSVASEIRQALRRMPSGLRSKRLGEAVSSGDDQTMAAVLTAPGWLSGSEPADLAMRQNTWRRKRYPAETARVERLAKALETLDRGGAALIAFIKDTAGANAPAVQLAEVAQRHALEAEQAAAAASKGQAA